jgi:hypothetical protein
MLTIDCIPPSFVNKFVDGIPVHGLIAAFLTHGNPNLLKKYEPWCKVWPSRRDFEDTMPILWPECLRASNSISRRYHSSSSHPVLLPPAASGLWNSFRRKKPAFEHEYKVQHQNLLAEQEKKLEDAWKSVVAMFPESDWETYSYYWLIVNTRSFYYLLPGEEPPEDHNDAMALVPFADYFNHVDDEVSNLGFLVSPPPGPLPPIMGFYSMKKNRDRRKKTDKRKCLLPDLRCRIRRTTICLSSYQTSR